MRTLFSFLILIFITACSHPLEIVGKGDILSASGDRDCPLSEFQAGHDMCQKNYVIDEYQEIYYAVPHNGWMFDHWVNYCTDASSNECSFDTSANLVRRFWGATAPPLKAVFAPASCPDGALPNVLFVLDNSLNWARASQQWPGGVVMGQSEVRAIAQVLADRAGMINVGLVEFSTAGNSEANDGGYVRFDLQWYDEAARLKLDAIRDKIFNDVFEPEEARSSSYPRGDVPWDINNYLSGTGQSKGGFGTPASMADPDAYSSQWDAFESPLGRAAICDEIHLIYIGNNVEGGMVGDDLTNSLALEAVYDDLNLAVPDALAGQVGDPLPMAEFVAVEVTEPPIIIPPLDLGDSAACWKVSEAEGGACAVVECAGAEHCDCYTLAASHPGCLIEGHPANRTYRWKVGHEEILLPGTTYTEIEPTGAYDSVGGLDYNMDDWAKLLNERGISVTVEENGESLDRHFRVHTHTIDVFNRQQNSLLSTLWFNAATVGGGQYHQAKSEAEIEAAIEEILAGLE